MKTALVEVQHLKKYYHQKGQGLFAKDVWVKAVNDISFSLYKGESFGLVGESGCGKSTTGQVLLQLIKKTSGKVLFQGEDVARFTKKQLKAWRKEAQIVFQDPYASLNPKKTIRWILHEPLMLHQIGDKKEREKRMVATLKDVGLDASYLDRYPHELSGGQRQRIAIGSAIILEPQFIVIDEGVSALDVSVQAQILNLLKALQKKYELTYLFISHDLNVVQYFCDRIAVMYLGEIVELGLTEEIRSNPKHPYSKALFSSIPSVVERKSAAMLQGEIPNAADLPGGCSFHTRCPLANEGCSQEKPLLKRISAAHIVTCHEVEGEVEA